MRVDSEERVNARLARLQGGARNAYAVRLYVEGWRQGEDGLWRSPTSSQNPRSNGLV